MNHVQEFLSTKTRLGHHKSYKHFKCVRTEKSLIYNEIVNEFHQILFHVTIFQFHCICLLTSVIYLDNENICFYRIMAEFNNYDGKSTFTLEIFLYLLRIERMSLLVGSV